MPEIFPWNPPLATGQWLTPQPVRDGPDPTPLQWPLAEPRMHRVLDKVPVGLAAADLQSGRFVFVNAFFCQLLGRRRDEFQNLRPMQIHPAEALPLVEADFAQLGAGMPPGPMVLPVLRGDGSQFMADIQRIPIELDGRAALLGIFTDISDRLQAQQALATRSGSKMSTVSICPATPHLSGFLAPPKRPSLARPTTTLSPLNRLTSFAPTIWRPWPRGSQR